LSAVSTRGTAMIPAINAESADVYTVRRCEVHVRKQTVAIIRCIGCEVIDRMWIEYRMAAVFAFSTNLATCTTTRDRRYNY